MRTLVASVTAEEGPRAELRILHSEPDRLHAAAAPDEDLMLR